MGAVRSLVDHDTDTEPLIAEAVVEDAPKLEEPVTEFNPGHVPQIGQNVIGDFYVFFIEFFILYFVKRFLSRMGQNWSRINQEWSHTPPRHFWGIFGSNHFSEKKRKTNVDRNPTAYKGFNKLQGFQPTTKVSTNLLDTNPTAYKTQILPTR
jgi:hypothetical protein